MNNRDKDVIKPKFSAWVLVIDDDIEARKLLVDILQKYGCTVFETSSSGDVIEMCKEVDYDIIFMELFLPSKKGFDIAQNIRNITNGMHRYIVGCSSAINSKEIVMECLKSGMTDCMAKPVSSTTIESRLHAWDIKKSYIQDKIIQSKRASFGTF